MRSEPYWMLLVAVLVPISAARPEERKPAPPDAAAVARGQADYQRYCQSCHGEKGDGRGPSAPWVDPKPRDFTRGLYKWRSTPTGTLPVDGDLARTIARGLSYSSMPRWDGLLDEQVQDLVAYLEHFSPRFSSEARGTPLEVPAEPPASPASLAEGKTLYGAACASCHGAEGRGDGPSANWPGFSDEWGHRVRPRDLTAGHLEGGRDGRDLYLLLTTGLDGTPMPSFATALTPAQTWAVVHYVRSLFQR
ncbi:MAG: cytochrome c [Myxococcales bacterium]